MKKIELYVHTQDGVDPKLIKLSEDATVIDIIQAINGGVNPHGEDLPLVFLEDGEEALDPKLTLNCYEIRHRHHVHCHRCKRIAVSVFYNRETEASFPPSTKVKRVLQWAIKEFHLTPKEAADKILVLKGAGDELPLDAHIGSFAMPGKCKVDLCLTAPVEVQG